MLPAVNVRVEPVHRAVGEAVIDATVGNGFTVALVVRTPVAVQPLASLITTLYVPVAAVVADAMVGFCSGDVNVFGPVHEYV